VTDGASSFKRAQEEKNEGSSIACSIEPIPGPPNWVNRTLIAVKKRTPNEPNPRHASRQLSRHGAIFRIAATA
jgi:hypothetical protein